MTLDPSEYVYSRIKLSYVINPLIYGVGLYIFAAGALVLAFRCLGGVWIRLITLALFVWLGTFSLAKAPIAATLVEVLIISVVLKPARSPARLIGVLFLAVLSAGLLFYMTSGGKNVLDSLYGLMRRLFLGEFADLPTYFNVFKENHASPLAMLPSYLKNFFGIDLPPPSKLLYLHGHSQEELLTVGMANSFFVGEAYAVAGILGVIVSPFIVAANIILVVHYFVRQEKTFFNVFIFGFLAYKFIMGLFSGISVYLLSSAQIIFMLHVFYTWFQRELFQSRR